MTHTHHRGGTSGFRPLAAAGAETPVLTVYTYDSFVSEWGPGPAVEAAFEATCGCDLQFVARRRRRGAAGAPAARRRADRGRCGPRPRHQPDRRGGGRHGPVRAARHRRPGARPAGRLGRRRCSCPSTGATSPSSTTRTTLAEPPASFAELAASDVSILIQDPRSSTPGLGLLLWVKAVYGDAAPAIWAGAVRQHRHRHQGLVRGLRAVPRGRGRHGAVLHHLARLSPDRRGRRRPRPRRRSTEGHYLQIEVAGKLAAHRPAGTGARISSTSCCPTPSSR